MDGHFQKKPLNIGENEIQTTVNYLYESTALIKIYLLFMDQHFSGQMYHGLYPIRPKQD